MYGGKERMLSCLIKQTEINKIYRNSMTTGIEVCQICLSMRDKLSISLSEISSRSKFEVLYVLNGNMIFRDYEEQNICVNQHEIILFSDTSMMRSVQISPDIYGILVSIDLQKARDTFSIICRIMGDWNLNIDTAIKNIKLLSGYAKICNTPWSFSVFSSLKNFGDQEQLCYGIWKTIELLYMINTNNIQMKRSERLLKDDHISEKLNDICSYMELHMDEKLTIENLCHRFYMSATSLKKHFRNVHGQPIHKWLLEKRMEKAAQLLRFSSMTIVQISQAVGYSGVSQFNVSFKKFFKYTPSQYRNLSNSVSISLIQKDECTKI